MTIIIPQQPENLAAKRRERNTQKCGPTIAWELSDHDVDHDLEALRLRRLIVAPTYQPQACFYLGYLL